MSENIQQTQSFLTTEFFFYMLPCYIAICAFGYRYYLIMQQQPKKTVKQLPAQFLITCFEEKYDFEQVEIPPASFVVKCKLSLMNSIIYLIMIFLGLLGDPDLYYSAQHRKYSLLYFLGFMAWAMSALILKRQFQRNISQALWTHRFFWIFAGTFSITKMFEDYLLPLNFIINSLFILDNTILIIYALYRVEDKHDGYVHLSPQVPTFARFFFQKFELNQTVRKLFKIQNIQIKFDFSQEITAAESADMTKQLQAMYSNMIPTAKNAQQQIKLLNKLPKRNILVGKRPKLKKANDGMKYYFLIITQINTSRFQIERKYVEFLQLQYSLSIHFSQVNFPKLNLPRINKIEFNNLSQNQNHRKAQILQQWLQAILNDPIFMIGFVLQFLNIDQLNSASFLLYYDVSYKSVCSKKFLINAYKQKNQIVDQQQKQNLVSIEQITKIKSYKMLAKKIKMKLQFEINSVDDNTQQNLYKYEIVCKINKKQTFRWTISKTEENFALLNSNIQEEIDNPVHFYYKYKSQDHKHQNNYRKNQIYRLYLQQLLYSEQYYTYALFQFILFDPVKLKTITQVNSRHSLFEKRFSDLAAFSIITQEFPQTNKLIEILGIKFEELQEQKYSYTFCIKKGQEKYMKDARQLLNLRKTLLKIYKGIDTIPKIPDFKAKLSKSDLVELKTMLDQFFQKLGNLDQISQNLTYITFFTHKPK